LLAVRKSRKEQKAALAMGLTKKEYKQRKKAANKKANTGFWISPFFLLLGIALFAFGYKFAFAVHLAVLILHEGMHAIVAKWRGYKVNSIKIMPYGAALNGKLNNLKPKDEILIALAGPLMNLLLVAITVTLWWPFPALYRFTAEFVYINLAMAAFNLLPLYPLDGGRVLIAILSTKYKRQKIYKVLRIIGLIAGILFTALFIAASFFAYNLSLALIAIFFFLSTLTPDKDTHYSRLYTMAFRSEKLKKGLQVREVVVSSDATILQLTKMLNSNYFYKFTILDKNFNKVKVIDEIDLESLSAKVGINEPVV